MSALSRLSRAAAVAVPALIAAAPASAFTVLSSGGEVTGFSDIAYDGGVYDLSLVNGTCGDIYGDCTDEANLPSAEVDDLLGFLTFVIDEVIVDTVDFAMDSDPTQLFGCSSSTVCYIMAPFAYNSSSVGSWTYLMYNYSAADGREDKAGSAGSYSHAMDTSTYTNHVYAQITRTDVTSAVPVPAAAALLPAGLAALGFAARRRRRG